MGCLLVAVPAVLLMLLAIGAGEGSAVPVSIPECERPECDGLITILDALGAVTAARTCPELAHRRSTQALAARRPTGDFSLTDGCMFHLDKL